MNNQTISNPKVEVLKGMMLNDKDYMNCLLSSLKALVKNYAVALTEVSNETLYQTYKQVFDGISSLQREAYELMFQRGCFYVNNYSQIKFSLLNLGVTCGIGAAGL